MTVIAILLCLALAGLLTTIGFIIAGALAFRKVPKRVLTMVEPPKNTVIEIINTGKGLAEVGKIRYDGYFKQGSRIYNSVKTSAEEVGTAAKAVDVDSAKSTLKAAAASINAAQEGLAAAKAVIDILNQARRE